MSEIENLIGQGRVYAFSACKKQTFITVLEALYKVRFIFAPFDRKTYKKTQELLCKSRKIPVLKRVGHLKFYKK